MAAIVLMSALPARPQAQLTLTDSPRPDAYVTGEITPANNEAADISVLTREAEPASQLSPEELGDILMARKRYQAAIQEFSKVIPASGAIWNKMGIAYQQLFALKEAARCYKEAVKLEPDNPKFHNNMGTIQDGMGDFESGERSYRRAIKLDPGVAMFYKNLGTNLLMQHKYAEGNQLYKQALELDPHIFDDHFGPKVNDPAPKQERGVASYFKAKDCARAGQEDCAIKYLMKAFSEGTATVKKVSTDEDFASMLGTPALTRLLKNEQ
jgi:tetratricopeptide (TPR) repeat protein